MTKRETSQDSDVSESRHPEGFNALFRDNGVGERLRAAGIQLTIPRLAIAQVMLAGPVHLTADEVLLRVRRVIPKMSRATVYNTLKLFKEKGLIRNIIVPDHVVFDSTTRPHYHFYNVDTGQVTDVGPGEITVVGDVDLPSDLELETIEVVVHVRRKSPAG